MIMRLIKARIHSMQSYAVFFAFHFDACNLNSLRFPDFIPNVWKDS